MIYVWFLTGVSRGSLDWGSGLIKPSPCPPVWTSLALDQATETLLEGLGVRVAVSGVTCASGPESLDVRHWEQG